MRPGSEMSLEIRPYKQTYRKRQSSAVENTIEINGNTKRGQTTQVCIQQAKSCRLSWEAKIPEAEAVVLVLGAQPSRTKKPTARGNGGSTRVTASHGSLETLKVQWLSDKLNFYRFDL
jgi:hypothetical protein